MKNSSLETPYFAKFLGSRIHPNIDFLKNAAKFLVDADQYSKWHESQPEFGYPITQIFGYCPFSQLWIEFYDFREMGHVYFYETYDFTDIDIYAIGYDLKTSSLFYIDNDDLIIREINVRAALKDPITKAFHQSLAWVTKYLEIEHVNAIRKQVKFDKSEFKNGKIIKHVSEYSVIYRKQPNQETVKAKNAIPEQVDWQFRWKVRGHWRRVNGKGKGPEGEAIDGFTWVRECVKGPDDKPLLDRPRIFKDQLPPNFIEVPGE